MHLIISNDMFEIKNQNKGIEDYIGYIDSHCPNLLFIYKGHFSIVFFYVENSIKRKMRKKYSSKKYISTPPPPRNFFLHHFFFLKCWKSQYFFSIIHIHVCWVNMALIVKLMQLRVNMTK